MTATAPERVLPQDVLDELTHAEAVALSRHGFALAYTAERGWHQIPAAEGLAVEAAAL